MASDQSESDKKSGKEGKVGETLKKVFTAGVSAAFMTEESIRNYLSELKMPKELMTAVLQNANKTKEEIAGRVSNEMVAMVKKMDFAEVMAKFARDHKFKISAEVEFVKKENKD